jgi:hypothetical protein
VTTESMRFGLHVATTTWPDRPLPTPKNRGPHLGMSSGVRFHPLDPKAEEINWRDIADGVCRMPRFSGQMPKLGTGETYVVGQHLCEGAALMYNRDEPEDAIKAWAIHDVTEGIWGLGDVCAPVKRVPELAAVIMPWEKAIDDVIAAKVGLTITPEIVATVRKYDAIMLLWENRDLRGQQWLDECIESCGLQGLMRLVPKRILHAKAIGLARKEFDEMVKDLGLDKDG